MKILLVVRHPVGGIRTYIKYMYSSPSLSHVEGRLIAPDSPELTGLLAETFAGRDFRHIRCKREPLGLMASVFRQLRKERPELIHSHGLTSGLLVAPVAKLLGIPHVLTTHDVFMDAHFNGRAGRIKKWLAGVFLRLPTVLNPVGADAAENLKRYFPETARRMPVRPVRNGIQVEYFLDDGRRDLRNELGLTDGTVLLGFFGRFMNQKGFNLLVEAVSRLSDAPAGPALHVVCFGWGGFIREEQAALKSRNLDGLFSFMPHTDDMPGALRGVDIVVIPSRWEACPLLPMEALTAGVPVVASDCIGMGEVTANTPARIFPTDDVDALVDVLSAAVGGLDELRERAEAFRPVAARRFDVAAAADKLDALYRDTLQI